MDKQDKIQNLIDIKDDILKMPQFKGRSQLIKKISNMIGFAKRYKIDENLIDLFIKESEKICDKSKKIAKHIDREARHKT